MVTQNNRVNIWFKEFIYFASQIIQIMSDIINGMIQCIKNIAKPNIVATA